jgi:pimeloyl-ACP methyl ester carboxylesterase
MNWGVEKCIIGGNSLGGNIAWRFTLENNKMVEKLLLIDASGYPMKSKSTPLAFKIAETPILKKHIYFYNTKICSPIKR